MEKTVADLLRLRTKRDNIYHAVDMLGVMCTLMGMVSESLEETIYGEEISADYDKMLRFYRTLDGYKYSVNAEVHAQEKLLDIKI